MKSAGLVGDVATTRQSAVLSEDDEDMAAKKQFCNKFIVLLVVGLLLAILGAILFPIVDHLVTEQIKKKVIISNKSELYEVWQDIPVPVYMQFYFFHVYNVEEIKAGQKPFVAERGPYTYRERRVKFNIVWNPNGTVTYRQNRTFYFIPEMSVGTEADLITTINPLMATLAQSFQWFPTGLKKAISIVMAVMTGDTMFTTRPVIELLWGYDDPSLVKLKNLVPWFIKSTNIGYFIGRNYTDDGLYTVSTGEADIGQLGKVQLFNGERDVKIWTTEWARMVNGTDGSLGPPFAFEKKETFAFVSDLCRSIRGVYRGDASVQDIALRRYGGDSSDMANASVNPDNIGFCVPQTKCLPSGLLNGTLCQKPVNGFSVPLIFSFPHFFNSDPEVIDSVYGMHPNKEEHDTLIDIEPWTGLVLQVAKRLQVNMFVEKVDGFIQTANIKPVYFPIFWLNESSVTDDKHANMLKNQLFTPLLVVKIAEIALLSIGGLLIVIGAGLLLRQYLKRRNSKPNIPQEIEVSV
ncbi:hypothetical protein BsWGS_15710 [Bradybaena similaris]